ncbi:MAG: prepilin-type N-terminal cleavage/methylation domain-containing protein [Candidatus Omnitrophica bacterium]|nr:prepilin-type N-terminal cleavage/methylation domain-containing protein [Candidatus Omnitrophota bacterium]
MINKNLKGYTLVEALISVLILSFMLLGVYGVLATGNTIITNDNALLEMQQQARNAMDRMVREVRESSTQTITVVSASSDKISFTTPNETGIQYYLSGTNLVREYPSGTIVKVANSIAYLKFTLSGVLLTISVRADKTLYTKTVSFALAENVRLRNE